MLTGVLLIGLAAVSWGTTGSVSAVLADRVEPLVIGAARMMVAAPLLLAGSHVITGPASFTRGDAARGILMGACMAAYQAAYFTAVTLTGVALTALIAICLAPLMIAVLAAALLGERLNARVAVALGLGVLGTALLVTGPPGGGAASGPGLLLALAAGLAYAVYVVVAKLTLARSAPLPLTALTFTTAALLLLPALARARDPLGQLVHGWPWLLYLGALATAGAYAAYTVGLRRVPASVAGIVALLEPLTATVLGVLIFGERLGAGGLLGALLLVTALGLALTASAPAPHGARRA